MAEVDRYARRVVGDAGLDQGGDLVEDRVGRRADICTTSLVDGGRLILRRGPTGLVLRVVWAVWRSIFWVAISKGIASQNALEGGSHCSGSERAIPAFPSLCHHDADVYSRP
jgi:hypothetical protein